jgi:hypothetical protein
MERYVHAFKLSSDDGSIKDRLKKEEAETKGNSSHKEKANLIAVETATDPEEGDDEESKEPYLLRALI